MLCTLYVIQGTNAEIDLEAGKMITLTTDDQYKEKCTLDMLWVDYKNIVKVVGVGKKIFIDDGLISLVCREIGTVSQYIVGLLCYSVWS